MRVLRLRGAAHIAGVRETIVSRVVYRIFCIVASRPDTGWTPSLFLLAARRSYCLSLSTDQTTVGPDDRRRDETRDTRTNRSFVRFAPGQSTPPVVSFFVHLFVVHGRPAPSREPPDCDALDPQNKSALDLRHKPAPAASRTTMWTSGTRTDAPSVCDAAGDTVIHPAGRR